MAGSAFPNQSGPQAGGSSLVEVGFISGASYQSETFPGETEARGLCWEGVPSPEKLVAAATTLRHCSPSLRGSAALLAVRD